MTAETVIAPAHPGEILLGEFLGPLGVSQYQLAKAERFWINLRARHDLEVEKDRLGTALDDIQPLSATG